MASNSPLADVTADSVRESDRDAERIGDFDEARCQEAPTEVKAQVDETLVRAFPRS